MNNATPEKLSSKAAGKSAIRAAAIVQRREAVHLRKVAMSLRARMARGDKRAAAEIDERCKESLAFRRVWSSLRAEGTRVRAGPRAENFTPKSRSVQGGRVNPR
jgi:hypothetical protein